MPVLVPCPSCARHVDVCETSCPFCASALPADLGSRAIPGTSRRLSRGAMFTFAATITAFGVVGACADDRGGDDSAYGCPSVEACEGPDGSIGDGAPYAIDGGYELDAASETGPPHADDAAGEDAD